jgi:transposase-like protein
LEILRGGQLKRRWAGEVRNLSLLVAIAVNGAGYREILGICEGAKEDKYPAGLCRATVTPALKWTS